jgi:hypothetical protein
MLAQMYEAQFKLAEVEPLDERCVAIQEKTLGPDDPALATALTSLARFYHVTFRLEEAEPTKALKDRKGARS